MIALYDLCKKNSIRPLTIYFEKKKKKKKKKKKLENKNKETRQWRLTTGYKLIKRSNLLYQDVRTII